MTVSFLMLILGCTVYKDLPILSKKIFKSNFHTFSFAARKSYNILLHKEIIIFFTLKSLHFLLHLPLVVYLLCLVLLSSSMKANVISLKSGVVSWGDSSIKSYLPKCINTWSWFLDPTLKIKNYHQK